MAILQGLSKVLSYGYVHARYVGLLIWPRSLCYDYGYDSVSIVSTLSDERNLVTFGGYGGTKCWIFDTGCLPRFAVVVFWVILAVLYRSKPLLLSLGWTIIAFIPASNVFMPVGTVVAERLLYAPRLAILS